MDTEAETLDRRSHRRRRLRALAAFVVALASLMALPFDPGRAFVLESGGFFAYDPSFQGGVQVAAGDVDGDGSVEIVTAAGAGGGPHVRVFDADGSAVAGWFAYAPSFRGGVHVAVGNVDSDPAEEVVTGAGPGGAPHVIVWDLAHGSPRVQGSRAAFGSSFRGGVRVATGDVEGADGRNEVIGAAGPGASPHVVILDGGGPTLSEKAGFYAYSTSFSGGVWVGSGDTDDDGVDEIVTGAGAGGSPHVQVFDAESVARLRGSFLAYSGGFTGGVRVGAGNVDDDPRAEVVTGAGPGGSPHVRVVSESGGNEDGFLAYAPDFPGGSFVGAGDVDGDGRDEVLSGAGSGGGPHVRSFDVLVDPALNVATEVGSSDVERAWDIAFLPSGELIWTELLSGELKLRTASGTVSTLGNATDLFVGSETGLMGLAVDPLFASNRRIYLCRGWTDGVTTDIRVEAWEVAADLGSAGPAVGNPVLVSGIPVSSGRHGGCRLLVDGDGNLRVTTGDAAIGTTPQDLASLGGKTLRVDRFSGAAVSGNPFVGTPGADARVFTYGHRNPQGLTRRPGTDQYFTAEHGPDMNDEVNLQVKGGNYGWDPVPGYNEHVPMTDLGKFPDAISPMWESGHPTTATSGITFVSGPQWKGWDGALLIANLKAQKVIVLFLDPAGRVRRRVDALEGGDRLRSVRQGPDGNLYLTTSNAGGNRILRVTPS